jgi:hypothetical protein
MIYTDVLIEFELMQPHKVIICRMHQAAWRSKSNKKTQVGSGVCQTWYNTLVHHSVAHRFGCDDFSFPNGELPPGVCVEMRPRLAVTLTLGAKGRSCTRESCQSHTLLRQGDLPILARRSAQLYHAKQLSQEIRRHPRCGRK